MVNFNCRYTSKVSLVDLNDIKWEIRRTAALEQKRHIKSLITKVDSNPNLKWISRGTRKAVKAMSR